ncbi:MAG: hypothetical protein JW384_01471 [Nitrosomonadaceae bacterium]|nr:hypothetical protein [Nitrosomonadaceae bacterium]
MITFIVIFCIALAIFSSMGLGAWGSLFASLGAMFVLGIVFNLILAAIFRDK